MESLIIDGRIILKQILQFNRKLYAFLPQVKINSFLGVFGTVRNFLRHFAC